MENKYAPQQKYDAVNTVKVSLKLNKTTDADILEVLEQAESKQGMIKQLVREGMKKSRG